MNYEAERRLSEKAKADSFYQELLKQCENLGRDYRRIRDGLPEKDQEMLEQYICVCEEMEYRRTCLAYAIGTQDGICSGVAQISVE